MYLCAIYRIEGKKAVKIEVSGLSGCVPVVLRGQAESAPPKRREVSSRRLSRLLVETAAPDCPSVCAGSAMAERRSADTPSRRGARLPLRMCGERHGGAPERGHYIAFESTFTIEDLPRNLASPGTGRGVII